MYGRQCESYSRAKMILEVRLRKLLPVMAITALAAGPGSYAFERGHFSFSMSYSEFTYRAEPPCNDANAIRQDANGQKDAEAKFKEGKQLIERNCVDCQVVNKVELAKGIKLLTESIPLEPARQIEAFTLLRQGFSMMAYGFAADGSEEQKYWIDQISKVTNRLIETDKDNPEWLLDKALQISDVSAKAEEVSKICRKYPEYATAQFAMANILRGQGKIAESVVKYESAYKYAQGLDVRPYGQYLISVLREIGNTKRAAQIEAELEKKY